MYAETADKLRSFIKQHPDENPSIFIRDDSFAAYCYDRYSLAQLRSAMHQDADPAQCSKWGLSFDQWRENIEMALAARASYENEPETPKKPPSGKLPLWYRPKG